MQCLEVSGTVLPLYGSLGVKGLMLILIKIFLRNLSQRHVTRDLADNSNITLLIVWFTSQRKVFNLKMAHERAETCR